MILTLSRWDYDSEEEPKMISKYEGLLRRRKGKEEKCAIKKDKREYKIKKFRYKRLSSFYQLGAIELPMSQNKVYNFCNVRCGLF